MLVISDMNSVTSRTHISGQIYFGLLVKKAFQGCCQRSMWEHTILLQPCKTIKAAPMDIVDFNEVVAYSLVFNVGFHTISCSCPIKANADYDLWVVLIFVEMVGKILHLCSYIAHIAVVNHIPQKQKHCRHTYIFHCIQHRCSKSNSPKSPSINLTCLIESIIAF